MNILFLSLMEAEQLQEGNLYHDLLLEFNNNNHNIFMVSPRERSKQLPTEITRDMGISILKVKTGNITQTNFLEKGISTLLIERNYLNAIKKFYSDIKFDLILYSTPPITFSRIVKYIKERDQAESYLLLKDIFPQNGVDIGLYKKSNPIFKYFRKREKELYQISDYIGCMSPANVEYLKKHNDLRAKVIEVCPNTITPQNVFITDDERSYIHQKYGLPQDKTIFVYGGNLGKPQAIDFLIECIKKNEENCDSYLLIVGKGTEYQKLANFFEKSSPQNAKLIHYLPAEEYSELVNSCDVGLILLDYRFTVPNFPSRLLSYLQASMPVLSATDSSTDIGKIVEDAQAGFACSSRDVERFNELLIQMTSKSLREKMGKNARRLMDEHYTSNHAYQIIIKHFQ